MTKQLNVLEKKTRFIDFNFIFIMKTKNDYIDNSFTMMLQCQSCRSFVRFLRIDWSFPLPPFRHCFVIFLLIFPRFPFALLSFFFFYKSIFFLIYFFFLHFLWGIQYFFYSSLTIFFLKFFFLNSHFI